MKEVRVMVIMDTIVAIVAAAGIPSAVMGLLIWWLKKHIDKNEARREQSDKAKEELILMLMRSTRANAVVCSAIGRAVQRIPDAHCNGDMTAALEKMNQMQKEEQDFLMEHGVKHIVEEGLI